MALRGMAWHLVAVLLIPAAMAVVTSAGKPLSTKRANDFRVIVRFADTLGGPEAADLLEQRVQRLRRKSGVVKAKALPRLGMAVASFSSEDAQEQFIEDAESDGDVELAVPDTWVTADDFKPSGDTVGQFQPPRNLKSNLPACSANPACAARGLVGDCCPAVSGMVLSCCSAKEPGRVVLKTYHGTFMAAFGDGTVNGSRTMLGTLTTFLLVSNGDGTMLLKTPSGEYLGIGPGRPRLTAGHSDLMTFKIITNEDQSVSFRNLLGKYLTAEPWGAFTASRHEASLWEQFTMLPQPAPGQRFPNDPAFSQLWGMYNWADSDIDAPEAWRVWTGEIGAGITVGVVDSGIDYMHEDLREQMWVNPHETPNNGIDDDGNGYVDDIHGANFIREDGDPMDDNMHGTHCSGTIAGIGNNGIGVTGVAWRGVRLMALKFLDAAGSGRTSDAIKAIDYAIAHGAKILSNSWGGGGSSSALRAAIERADSAGVFFLAAAGNEGTDNDQEPHYPAGYEAGNVVAVASTTVGGELSSFSCYGRRTVHVAAPGSDIYSTIPGNRYEKLSGTSMATPHVSGLAALVWMYRPMLSMPQVKRIILSSVERLPALDGKVVTNGLINAKNALEAAWAFEPPKPPKLAPRGIAFEDVDPRRDSLAGVVTIAAAADESDIDYYRVYFLSGAGFQLASLGKVRATGAAVLALHINGSFVPPLFAKALVAVSGRTSGEMPGHFGGAAPHIELEDLIVPLLGPGSVAWGGDADLRRGLVKGKLFLRRAEDESSITRYNIYWRSQDGARGPLVGSIPATGFQVPSCRGPSCEHLVMRRPGQYSFVLERINYTNDESATIFLSGPGTIIVTRLDTERGYDTLKFGATEFSGPLDGSLPLRVAVPEGPFTIEWRSDDSGTAGGWRFELAQAESGAKAVFDLESTAVRGYGLDVVSAYGQTELPRGAFAELTDYDDSMPPSPAFTPSGLQFKDVDSDAGVVAGTVKVQPAAEVSGIDFYRADFADAEGGALGPGWTSVANGSATVFIAFPSTAVPEGAVQLIARAGNRFGLSATFVVTSLVDMLPRVPDYGPSSVFWAGDSDLRRGNITGVLFIGRAENESSLTQYNVHWRTDDGGRPLVASIPATGFIAPSCRGPACQAITTRKAGRNVFTYERIDYENGELAVISGTGPARVIVTRFDTEQDLDTLTLGSTRLSGDLANSTPMVLELPEEMFNIEWRSYESGSGRGWRLELVHMGAMAEFQFRAAVPKGAAVEVVSAYGKSERPNGTFVDVLDYYEEMPPSPVFTPSALHFEDTDPAAGIIAGRAVVRPAEASAGGNVAFYSVGFADANGKPLAGGEWRGTANGSATVLVSIPNATVPEGAAKLIVRAGNRFGLGERSASVAAFDIALIPDQCRPTFAAWAGDTDLRETFVKGTLMVGRATNESSITHYNIHWRGRNGTLGPLVGSIPSVGFLAPSCRGPSCGRITKSTMAGNAVVYEHTNYTNGEIAIISGSGPARVLVMRLDTEQAYDVLSVGSMQLSGNLATSMPLEIQLPRGPFSIQWHSDESGTRSGWKFEIIQAERAAEFELPTTMAKGLGLEVFSMAGKARLPQGVFTEVVDYNALMWPSPAFAPSSVHFVDEEPLAGVVAGIARVQPSSTPGGSGGVTFYRIDLADAQGNPLIGGWTGRLNGSAAVLIAIPTVAVPMGAVKLIARSGNRFGLCNNSAIVELVEMIRRIPKCGPASVLWAGDMDPRKGFVQGKLLVSRARDESSIYQYNIYWRDQNGTRGPRVGRILATGFQEAFCRGPSCEQIATRRTSQNTSTYERAGYTDDEAAVISGTGPAHVTVTRFDTEADYDTLTLGSTQLSGSLGDSLPLKVELPEERFAIQWRSDNSATSEGWKFELAQSGAMAEFELEPTAAQGWGLEVVAAYGTAEFAGGAFAQVVDRDGPTAPPLGLAALTAMELRGQLDAGTVRASPTTAPSLGAQRQAHTTWSADARSELTGLVAAFGLVRCSVVVPGLDAVVAAQSTIRAAFSRAIAMSLPSTSAGDVHVVRVRAVTAAQALHVPPGGRRLKEAVERALSAHSSMAAVDFEVEPSASKGTLDRVEARLILLSMGGPPAARLDAALVAELQAAGAALPLLSQCRSRVGEPQLLGPTMLAGGQGRRLEGLVVDTAAEEVAEEEEVGAILSTFIVAMVAVCIAGAGLGVIFRHLANTKLLEQGKVLANRAGEPLQDILVYGETSNVG